MNEDITFFQYLILNKWGNLEQNEKKKNDHTVVLTTFVTMEISGEAIRNV